VAGTCIHTSRVVLCSLYEYKFVFCCIKLHAVKLHGGMEEHLHFSKPQHLVELSGQLHALASLLPGKLFSVNMRLSEVL